MSRVIHVFRSPDRFVAGTVGQPGERAFYLQAVQEARVVSVLLEKQQVQVLAERVGALLEEVARRFGADVGEETEDAGDLQPLTMPVEEEFRVGTMGLGWDSESSAVVVELLAATEAEVDESMVLDDTEEGPRRGAGVPLPGAGPPLRRPLRSRHRRRAPALPPVRGGPEPLGPHLRPHQRLPPRRRHLTRRGAAGPGLTPTVAAPLAEPPDVLELLAFGALEVTGRITGASNTTLLCSVELDGMDAHCVYKPVRGERPLWDFPDGTLAGREVGSYLVSAATGWGVIPPTVLRAGPFGTGMVQLWIDTPGAGPVRCAGERGARRTDRPVLGRRGATRVAAGAARGTTTAATWWCSPTPTTLGCGGWPCSTW